MQTKGSVPFFYLFYQAKCIVVIMLSHLVPFCCFVCWFCLYMECLLDGIDGWLDWLLSSEAATSFSRAASKPLWSSCSPDFPVIQLKADGKNEKKKTSSLTLWHIILRLHVITYPFAYEKFYDRDMHQKRPQRYHWTSNWGQMAS